MYGISKICYDGEKVRIKVIPKIFYKVYFKYTYYKRINFFEFFVLVMFKMNFTTSGINSSEYIQLYVSLMIIGKWKLEGSYEGW